MPPRARRSGPPALRRRRSGMLGFAPSIRDEVGEQPGLWVGGSLIDISTTITDGSLVITNSGYRATGVMTFRAEFATGTVTIASENEVIFQVPGTRLYGGLVKVA